MDTIGADVAVFAAFGVSSQAVLAGFFAARRWLRSAADRFGWIAYAFAGLGLPVGIWLLVGGASWRLFVGPMLLAVWAGLGVVVDLWRPVQWRRPIKWQVFVPYLALYFWAQMFLWWPLWNSWRAAWFCFLAMFIVNTVLNLTGHLETEGEAR